MLSLGASDWQNVGGQDCVIFGGEQKVPRGTAQVQEQFSGWHVIIGLMQLSGQRIVSQSFWQAGQVDPSYTAPVQLALHSALSVQVPFVQPTVQLSGRQLGAQCCWQGGPGVNTQVQLGPRLEAATTENATQRRRSENFMTAAGGGDSKGVYTETRQMGRA